MANVMLTPTKKKERGNDLKQPKKYGMLRIEVISETLSGRTLVSK
jgi:hypothetical protein